MEGSEGAMAMSPIVETPSLSKTGVHVVPLFVVFHTPPEAIPTKTMFGLLSTTAKSSTRPPITAGPSSRNSRLFNLSVGFGWSAPGTASAPAEAHSTRLVSRTSSALDPRDIRSIIHTPCVAVIGPAGPVLGGRHDTAAGRLPASIVSGSVV